MAINPVGWQLLVKPMSGPEKIGGVFLTDATKEENKVGATVCEVVAMGPDCYNDVKYGEPWVGVGDYIMVGKFVGSRFNYKGEEHRLINDDQVIGTVDDPGEVTRAL